MERNKPRKDHFLFGLKAKTDRHVGIEELDAQIARLVKDNAYHVKRGFGMKDVPLHVIATHMLEEAVELQAEAICGSSHHKRIGEAADLLSTVLHLCQELRLPLEAVMLNAKHKLEHTFTTDPSKIKTLTPGFSRSNRSDTADPQKPTWRGH